MGRGGPDQADLDQARAFSTELGSRGDVLMFGGKKGEALAGQLLFKVQYATAVKVNEESWFRISNDRSKYNKFGRIMSHNLALPLFIEAACNL